MGILYKDTLALNPRCSRLRRIDEVDISTPVEVDQRAAYCLEEAVRLFTAMRSRCQSSRADVTSIVHCQLFDVRWSTASKLASLWNCSTAHELLLSDRKILLLEGR
ncbi:uncharacterized protein TNCV_4470751 [Trichonephila clavipes]|uniref:Uncharacterized protein n=1 Tax=Trichonephila clavipes TaxID=2585209 RepID=A0A8X6VFT8_TRICX|nr:uncharacterized protein TNCV_4470751 [Trichonephila clavipes]